MSENTIIVIDNGGSSIKAGIAGDDNPTAVVPNGIGLEQFVNLSDEDTFKAYTKAYSNGDLKVRYPISKGSVTNWEDMEALWKHVIEEHLHVLPEESSLLITEPISNPRPAREKMAEILFEKLNFNAINIATAPILPMYAAGRTSGIVLDVGDGITQVVPIWGGYPITDAMCRIEYGGRDVTDLLSKEQLNRQNLQGSKTPPEVFRMMKEKMCHIVPDFSQAHENTSSSTTYELPNGDKIEVGEEAYKCPEFLFNPSKFEERETARMGLQQWVYNTIMKTNIDVRKDLYSNIVLSGGSTLYPGFVERMENELRALAPNSVKINVIAHPARKYFTWIGGSVLASLTSFPSSLVTKQSWEEGSGRIALNK